MTMNVTKWVGATPQRQTIKHSDYKSNPFFKIPEKYVAYFSGAEDGTWSGLLDKRKNPLFFKRLNRLTKPQNSIENVYSCKIPPDSFVWSCSTTFGHFLLEDVPAISVAHKNGLDVYTNIQKECQRDWLKDLGLNLEKICVLPSQFVVPNNGLYTSEIPNLMSMCLLSDWVFDVYDDLQVAPVEKDIDVLYFGRKEPNHRRIVNEKDLGVPVFYPEDLSPKEQLDSINRTKLLVSPYGSGNLSIAYARPLALLEIFPQNVFPNHFGAGYLATKLGINYHYIEAKSIENNQEKPRNKDMEVDTKSFKEVTQKILTSLL